MSNMTMNINQPSGKFLKIVHRINDGLFLMGTKKLPVPILNINKLNSEMQPAEEKVEINKNNEIITDVIESLEKININDEKIENELDKNAINDNLNNNENFIEGKDETNECDFEEEENLNDENEEIENDDELHPINSLNSLNPSDEQEKKQNQLNTNLNNLDTPLVAEEIPPKISQEENDKNILTLFLHLIKLHFKENRDLLPMDPGKLFKDYLKPLSSELNIPFDFKTSSYKKTNNFLKTMQKEKNLLTFGKPKGGQNDYILSILWEHPIITDFIPLVKTIKFIEESNSEEEKENIILQKDEKIQVSQLFKPNQKIKSIFSFSEKNFDNSKYYSLKHCNEVLTTYLKLKDLFLQGGRIRLSPEIKEALFKHEDLNENADACPMDKILVLWKKNLNEKSFITKTGSNQEQTILTNNGLKVKIYARKINNKNVTIIDGLQNFVNVKDVIKIFSKHFACAVTLKDFQQATDAVFIQGYWVSELVQILQDEIKLNKQFIQVEDKLNLKVKKNKK